MSTELQIEALNSPVKKLHQSIISVYNVGSRATHSNSVYVSVLHDPAVHANGMSGMSNMLAIFLFLMPKFLRQVLMYTSTGNLKACLHR